MTRQVLAIALGTIIASFSLVSSAEPSRATPAAPPPKAGTTTTTAATLVPTEAGERAEERELVRPHRSMLITGSAILLGSYGVSAVFGAVSDTDADKRLYVPLVGPWLDLGERQCGLAQCGVREDINILHIIGSGAAQATGLGIAIASLFVEERRGGRPAPQRPAPEPPRTTWRVVPHFAGIGAVGTF